MTRSHMTALAVACGVVVPATVAAHGGAKGVVKERMDMMKSMAATMKAVNEMVRGKRPLDAATVRQGAKEMSGHATMLPKKFPKGSGHPPSEAKPEIWRQPEKFRSLWMDLNEKVADLARAGEAGDHGAIAKAFRDVGRVCSACHKTYRAKNQ
jgi:cytochrome c556